MNKFEKLIDLIVNENTDQAQKLFHSIVVENSRKIYESLNEADACEDDIEENEDEVEKDEKGIEEGTLRSVITAEGAKSLLDYMDGTLTESRDTKVLFKRVMEHFGVAKEDFMGRLEEEGDEILDIAYGEEEDDMDSMDAEISMGDEGDMEISSEEGEMDMGGEGEMEDRVVDLEDAIDELQAEFDALINGEEGEEDFDMEAGEEDFGGDEDFDVSDDQTDDFAGDIEGEDDDMEESIVREYVEKVSDPSNSEEGATNKKSTVAGKNDMGGTVANMNKGSAEEKGGNVDKPSNLKGAGSFENDPKAKAGKTFSNAKAAQTKEPAGTDKKSLVK